MIIMTLPKNNLIVGREGKIKSQMNTNEKKIASFKKQLEEYLIPQVEQMLQREKDFKSKIEKLPDSLLPHKKTMLKDSQKFILHFELRLKQFKDYAKNYK